MHKKRLIILAGLGFFAAVFPSCFNLLSRIPYSVDRVIDGDTFVVKPGLVTVRLYGIDCPETGQPYGLDAKTCLLSLLSEKIHIDMVKMDIYGRTVGIIYSSSGLCLNTEMITRGMAWVYEYFCAEPYLSEWLKLQDTARKQQTGLWSQPDPVPPWEW